MPTSVREHVAALRAMAGAVEELEVETCRRRSTAPRCSARSGAASSGWSTSGPTNGIPVFWVNHLFQGLYAVLARTGEAAGRARARGARAAPRGPGFLDAARATLEEPPSVFVDSALAMLGGGGELIVQLAATLGGAAPGSRRRAQGGRRPRRSRRSSASAPRSATRSSRAPIRMRSRSARSSSRGGSTSSTRSCPARPSSGATASICRRRPTAQLAALAAELSPRPWRELVDELRNDAPATDAILDTYRA